MYLHNLFCKNRVRPDPLAELRHDLEKLKQEHEQTKMKLSQLAGVTGPLVTQVSQIATDVAALKANQTDPELPTDAASNITALQTGLQSLADSVKPAAPNPS